MSTDYEDPLDDYDDDRYLREAIMANSKCSGVYKMAHIRSYRGFDDYSKFEDVLRSIEESIEDGTAYVGKMQKKHGKRR